MFHMLNFTVYRKNKYLRYYTTTITKTFGVVSVEPVKLIQYQPFDY